MNDGYSVNEMTFENEVIKEKFIHIQGLRQKQISIDDEICALSKEIETLPSFPHNMDSWITSFSTDFKMGDFKKIFDINKRYRHLLSEREVNQHKIKEFALDNLIEQIKEITEVKQS